MKGFPPLITLLLISSLVLTIGRAITLPFITIYMTEHFHLKPESVGLILGFSLAIGIVSSFYGGYLVDKFNKHHLMILSIALFAMTFCIMPWLGNVWWMVPVLTLLHAAYSVFSIAIKACFAEWLPVSERIRGFSMNYTLVNVGWAVGPALGVFAASYYPMLPFFLSGMLAFFVGLTLWLRLDGYGLPPNNGDTVFTEQRLNFSATFKILSHDRRLIFFTLGSTMGAVVAGQFTGYLSQYLITVSNAQFAYQVIGSVMTVNASVVICLQYLLSRNMNNKNLLRWLTAGTLFFCFGLVGFALADRSIPMWMVAMAIFTLGEVIVIPVEYLFIDFIAPPHLKGSYYGVQNLGNLGGAVNPILCGFLLSFAPPTTLFYVLVAVSLLGLGFFWYGYRLSGASVQHIEG
ncbi:MAG: MFS transporter [Hafnia paralvei]|uniref:MFS transporter n=1 Tax=Hafnia paralvei TaxID=546367 RepID=UPI001585B316|nr:MFS transporter [Hafnia paralvei]MCE9880261.1 MFS transporter [Hafnia paralvei]MCE9908786.1 MFS transporter [Hafnia paralvei]MCE9913897.1 MFS transporter [Hafnia paralvei]NUN43258.1 MFS transporter [Hafnia paralvei]